MEIVKLWRFSLLLLQYIFASACNCYEMPFLFNWLSRVIFMNFDTFFFLGDLWARIFVHSGACTHTEREQSQSGRYSTNSENSVSKLPMIKLRYWFWVKINSFYFMNCPSLRNKVTQHFAKQKRRKKTAKNWRAIEIRVKVEIKRATWTITSMLFSLQC